MKRPKEADLYPRIERWLQEECLCFATAVNTGLSYSRPDVTGVRDIGGDLSGEIESIIVEVKRGTQPFATASGQTLGYRVYANRVYLADYRQSAFSIEEVHIASHLGIGLIQIKGKNCIERLSSPSYTPITSLHRALLEKLGLGYCQLCGSVFNISEPGKLFTNLARENIQRAIEKGKGLVFWNRELADRKRKLGMRTPGDGKTYERRFVCPDCVESLLSEFKLLSEG